MDEITNIIGLIRLGKPKIVIKTIKVETFDYLMGHTHRSNFLIIQGKDNGKEQIPGQRFT